MTNQLRNMMAEIESWESATEFGIPQDLWAGYQVRKLSDDLYIAALSAVFDTLRVQDSDSKKQDLSELAKTLLIYSHSAASEYLTGIDRTINMLYCAATFYLADFPATSTFVTRQITHVGLSEEENFLYALLSHKFNENTEIESKFLSWLGSSDDECFSEIISHFVEKQRQGLIADPRLFIASKLIVNCLGRFKEFNILDNLRKTLQTLAERCGNHFLLIFMPFQFGSFFLHK